MTAPSSMGRSGACGSTAIAADDVISKLSIASKLDANWDFLTSLRDAGRARAEQWLDAHFEHVGVEFTVDLQALYM